jgi:hypothetical protein
MGEEAGKLSCHAPLRPGHHHVAKHSPTEIALSDASGKLSEVFRIADRL